MKNKGGFFKMAKTKSFDAEKWINDHKVISVDLGFKDNKKLEEFKDKEVLHFYFSYKNTDFRAMGFNTKSDRMSKMFDLFNDLVTRLREGERFKVPEHNTLKDGSLSQKTRVVTLQGCEVAYHNFGPDQNQRQSDETQEHIHIIAHQGSDAAKSWGSHYNRLKAAVAQISSEHGLVPNFADTPSHYNPQAVKNLAASVKTFSKTVRMADNQKLAYYVQSTDPSGENWLEKKVELAQKLAVETGNLQYYSKTMDRLQKRLNSLDIDFEFQGHNLRESFPIPLRVEDVQTIDYLMGRSDTYPNAQNTILNAYVNWSLGDSAPVIDALKKHTTEIDGLRRNKEKAQMIDKEVHQARILKIRPQTNDKGGLSDEEKITEFKLDLLRALKTASNEKELKQELESYGWGAVGDKTYRGERIGLTIQVGDKKETMKFKELGIERSEIIHTLQTNAKKKESQQISENTQTPQQEENEMSKIDFVLANKKIKDHQRRLEEAKKQKEQIKLALEQELEFDQVQTPEEEKEEEPNILNQALAEFSEKMKEELKDYVQEAGEDSLNEYIEKLQKENENGLDPKTQHLLEVANLKLAEAMEIKELQSAFIKFIQSDKNLDDVAFLSKTFIDFGQDSNIANTLISLVEEYEKDHKELFKFAEEQGQEVTKENLPEIKEEFEKDKKDKEKEAEADRWDKGWV